MIRHTSRSSRTREKYAIFSMKFPSKNFTEDFLRVSMLLFRTRSTHDVKFLKMIK
jgi:hypothetical protein